MDQPPPPPLSQVDPHSVHPPLHSVGLVPVPVIDSEIRPRRGRKPRPVDTSAENVLFWDWYYGKLANLRQSGMKCGCVQQPGDALCPACTRTFRGWIWRAGNRLATQPRSNASATTTKFLKHILSRGGVDPGQLGDPEQQHHHHQQIEAGLQEVRDAFGDVPEAQFGLQPNGSGGGLASQQFFSSPMLTSSPSPAIPMSDSSARMMHYSQLQPPGKRPKYSPPDYGMGGHPMHAGVPCNPVGPEELQNNSFCMIPGGHLNYRPPPSLSMSSSATGGGSMSSVSGGNGSSSAAAGAQGACAINSHVLSQIKAELQSKLLRLNHVGLIGEDVLCRGLEVVNCARLREDRDLTAVEAALSHHSIEHQVICLSAVSSLKTLFPSSHLHASAAENALTLASLPPAINPPSLSMPGPPEGHSEDGPHSQAPSPPAMHHHPAGPMAGMSNLL